MHKTVQEQDQTQSILPEQQGDDARSLHALKIVLEATAAVTGKDFFLRLVRHIAEATGVRYAFISQAHIDSSQAHTDEFETLAAWADGEIIPNQRFDFNDVPCCKAAFRQGCFLLDNQLQLQYPNNPLFVQLNAQSYLGVAIKGTNGQAIGNLCILDDGPLQQPQVAKTLLEIFAVRAGAEIERLQAEAQLEQANTKLTRLVEVGAHELKQREAELQDFVDNANDLILSFFVDNGYFEYANHACRHILGYSDEDIRQLTIYDIVHPNYQDQLLSAIQQIKGACNCPIGLTELAFLTHDQRIVYVEGNINCRIQDDKAVTARAIFRDVTHRKQAELAIQTSEARYRSLITNLLGAVYRCVNDDGWTVEFMSNAVYEITGYPAADFIQQPWLTFTNMIVPEDYQRNLEIVKQALSEQVPFILEYRLRHADGSLHWIYEKGQGIFDPQNQLLSLDGVIVDISDRKNAEIALEKSRQLLQAVLDAVPLSIFWKDRESVYLGCNQIFAQHAGLESTEAVLGLTDFDLPWSPDEAQAYRADDQEVIQTQQAKLGITEPLGLADGGHLWIETNKVPIQNGAGEVIGVLGTYQDISDRKQYEDRLEQTNVELARATRMKDEFLANMSHELRTPLNAILGISEGLQDNMCGSLNERQQQLIGTIERSGTHLLDLINDILDLSKIEAGKLELYFSDVSLKNLCSASLSFVKQLAFNKQINLSLKIPPDLTNLKIHVDDRRIRQALINLLSNAVKFTPEAGEITLSAFLEYGLASDPSSASSSDPSSDPLAEQSQEALPEFVCFSVCDTGIGIDPQHLNHLFQPFVQLETKLNRNVSGTGLGLALVKRFVELHGGEVIVTSELDQGSCFTIQLPFLSCMNTQIQEPKSYLSNSNRSKAETIPPLSSEQANAPTILIAEDNQANIETLVTYLENFGYQTVMAYNGLEALQALEHCRPDIILMDIQMPVMDGYEAMRKIRANPAYNLIPIVALTALAMPGDHEKCIEAGANEYLTKPIRFKKLVTILENYISG